MTSSSEKRGKFTTHHGVLDKKFTFVNIGGREFVSLWMGEVFYQSENLTAQNFRGVNDYNFIYIYTSK